MTATVCIGRAHEHDDPGASTPGGLSEWKASWAVCCGIKQVLVRNGVKAIGPVAGSLGTRIALVRYMHRTGDCHVVVEPHFNHIADPETYGHFVLAWHSSRSACRLARMILDELDIIRPGHSRGICRVAPGRRWVGTPIEYSGGHRLGLLQYTPCPAVIVEYGHASSDKDACWIERESSRLWIGHAIGRGIYAYLQERNLANNDGGDHV